MASLLHYTTLLLLILLLSPATVAYHPTTSDEALVEDYTLDNDSFSSPLSRRSRFLKKIRKGMHCSSAFGNRYNICNGVSANNGTSILHCCKKHCRNVLSDKNNCRVCGHKCRYGQRCCGGACIHVMRNPNHCGKCNRRCPRGVSCDYGICGYA